jgi:hypothetical protein
MSERVDESKIGHEPRITVITCISSGPASTAGARVVGNKGHESIGVGNHERIAPVAALIRGHVPAPHPRSAAKAGNRGVGDEVALFTGLAGGRNKGAVGKVGIYGAPGAAAPDEDGVVRPGDDGDVVFPSEAACEKVSPIGIDKRTAIRKRLEGSQTHRLLLLSRGTGAPLAAGRGVGAQIGTRQSCRQPRLLGMLRGPRRRWQGG